MTERSTIEGPRRVALYARYSTDMQNPTVDRGPVPPGRALREAAGLGGRRALLRQRHQRLRRADPPRLPAAVASADLGRSRLRHRARGIPRPDFPRRRASERLRQAREVRPASRSTRSSRARRARVSVGLASIFSSMFMEGLSHKVRRGIEGNVLTGPERRRPDLRLPPRHRRPRRAGEGHAGDRRGRGRHRAGHLPRLRRRGLADQDREPAERGGHRLPFRRLEAQVFGALEAEHDQRQRASAAPAS